jgi:hypothetical protein
MFLQLIAEDGEDVSTAEIDDAFWMTDSAAIKACVLASFPGFAFYELGPDEVFANEVERKLTTMMDVDNWVATINDPA